MTIQQSDLRAVNALPHSIKDLQEATRLAALRGLGLLDTSPTEAFDRVTRLAAQALRAPIILVSLVDESRQWFKSKFGIDAPQTPRSVSFCAHAVAERRVLIVRDATSDPRFRENPLVTGEPHIRAYAGVPLYTLTGHAIGTLCAIDRKCRSFDDAELNVLRDFALVIEDMVQALERPAFGGSSAAEHDGFYRGCFDNAGLGMIHASLSGFVLHTNPRLRAMLGYGEEDLKRMTFADLTHPEDLAEASELFQQTVAGTIDRYRLQMRYVRANGNPFWIDLSVSLKRGASGQPEFVIALVDDITRRKRAELELVHSRDALKCEVMDKTRKLDDNGKAMRRHVKQLLSAQHAARRADDRLRSIGDGVPVMIGYWNRDLRCEYANEACWRWFGISPERIIGMTFAEVLGEAQFRDVQAQVELVLGGVSQRFDSVVPRGDGTVVHLDVRYVPDVTSDGEVRGFTSTATDSGARLPNATEN